MSEHLRQPSLPWPFVIPFVLFALAFWVGVRVEKRFMHPVRAYYVWTYLRMSWHLPHSARQTLLVEPNGSLATPQTTAPQLFAAEQPIRSGPDLYLWLRQNVYGDQPVKRVLLPAELPALLLYAVVMLWAQRHYRHSQKEAWEGRLLRGARLVSHWRWNMPLLFRKRDRGLYISTK